MADVFTNIIFKMKEIGAFNFLFPFMLTSAIFYGILRKSKIFGTDSDRNVAVNGVIALSAAFMVWAFPILRGVDVETQLSTFFMQGMVVILVFMLGLMIAGLVLPEDLPKNLWEKWKNSSTPTTLFLIGLAVAGVIFVASGLVSIFITPEAISAIPSDILTAIVVIFIMIIPLIWIAQPSGQTIK
ncbi:MAG: hypothetical protein QXM68_03590 [Candidatus Aenigmatarchaeota archaeon]|nr:hypothetical protein [Candidatus Aenigmarchaeota archaeon]